MSIGGEHYDKRIRIERMTTSRDPSGEDIETWTTQWVRWARIKPLTGSERYLAHQFQPELQFKVEIRYTDGLRARDRINFKGRYLDILSVVDPGEAHDEMVLMCSEWRAP